MRDVLLKIIEKLHIICTSLAGTKTTTDELSTAVSGLGKTVFTSSTVEVAEDTVVASGAMVELNGVKLSTLIPSGAIFICASIRNGTTAHMGELVLQKVWWSSNTYLGILNPTASSITVPAGKKIEIVYAV